MTDQVTSAPFVDNSNIQWVKSQSQNGQAFEIGVLKAESDSGADESLETETTGTDDIKVLASVADSEWITVNWPVGDNNWKSTTGTPAAAAGITRYRLYYNGFPNIYSWTLDFTNTTNIGYYFRDESGDIYPISIQSNGNHWIKYNSDKPTVVAVKYVTA